MKLTYKNLLGYANIVLGFTCILSWLFNSLGWIRLGDPTGQLIVAPVCFLLGTMLLPAASKKGMDHE
jgi:hypothetical protein